MRDSIYNEDQQALIRDYQVKYQMAEKEHELELQEEKTRQSRRLLYLSMFAVALLLILVVVLAHNAIQRKKRNEMLTNLNKTKDQLFTVVSHDIKTPVLAQEKSLDVICNHIDDIPLEYLKEYLIALKLSTKELKAKMINVVSWVLEDGSEQVYESMSAASKALGVMVGSIAYSLKHGNATKKFKIKFERYV